VASESLSQAATGAIQAVTSAISRLIARRLCPGIVQEPH